MSTSKPKKKKAEGDDFKLAPQPERPHISEGRYLLRCTDSQVVNLSFGRRAILHFEVLDLAQEEEVAESDFRGKKLFMSMPLPKKHEDIPAGSKFYQMAYVLQNGYPLERVDRISLRWFRGITFKGVVRDAKPRYGPAYSVVGELLSRVSPWSDEDPDG